MLKTTARRHELARAGPVVPNAADAALDPDLRGPAGAGQPRDLRRGRAPSRGATWTRRCGSLAQNDLLTASKVTDAGAPVREPAVGVPRLRVHAGLRPVAHDGRPRRQRHAQPRRGGADALAGGRRGGCRWRRADPRHRGGRPNAARAGGPGGPRRPEFRPGHRRVGSADAAGACGPWPCCWAGSGWAAYWRRPCSGSSSRPAPFDRSTNSPDARRPSPAETSRPGSIPRRWTTRSGE